VGTVNNSYILLLSWKTAVQMACVLPLAVHCVSKKVPTFQLSVTLSNLNRFPKFLHCWKA